MRISKTIAKTVSRKAVSKAIVRQEADFQQTGLNTQLTQEQIQDAIRLKAYELYTRQGGTDVDNWLTAEQIILSNTAFI